MPRRCRPPVPSTNHQRCSRMLRRSPQRNLCRRRRLILSWDVSLAAQRSIEWTFRLNGAVEIIYWINNLVAILRCEWSLNWAMHRSMAVPQWGLSGCSSPRHGRWARSWMDHWVCDAWPVRCQTYGYLPSCRASPPFGRYQIILLGDRGTWVWTTCPELLRGSGLVGSRTPDLSITSQRPNHWATKPPKCILDYVIRYFAGCTEQEGEGCWKVSTRRNGEDDHNVCVGCRC